MTVFEYVFSLYSLLFGLALAQVFGGFGNTLQERHKLKVGWLTPLLGLFVIVDLTSFWEIGWELRGMSGRPYFLYLLAGVPPGWDLLSRREAGVSQELRRVARLRRLLFQAQAMGVRRHPVVQHRSDGRHDGDR